MAKSHVELDFFGLQNLPNSLAQPQPRLDRRQSFRGIAKINPEIVKSVFASARKNGAADNSNNIASNSLSLPGSPHLGTSQLPIFHPHPGTSQLPIFHPHPLSRVGSMESAGETAPMTIFYNGTVTVFDLPHDKAEYIMKKLSMEKNVSKNEEEMMDHSFPKSSQTTTENIIGPLDGDDGDGDMPIKRKKSLQRFFEKRKERLVTPYSNVEHMASGLYKQKSY